MLQLARLAYQGGDDQNALALYQRVGRSGPEWLDALFEASWAHFRTAEDEKALGNLLTLHAPFFQDRFFPESFVLKALVMYQNCRYADARAALAEFEQRYRPLHDGLALALEKIRTPESASDFIAHGSADLAPGAREAVARIEDEPDLRGASQAAIQLAQEIDSIDRRPKPFRESALIARVVPLARKTRMALLESAGRRPAASCSRAWPRSAPGCASCSASRCASPTRSPAARRSWPPTPKARRPRPPTKTRRTSATTRRSGRSRASIGATSWAATSTSSAAAAGNPGFRRRPRRRPPLRPRSPGIRRSERMLALIIAAAVAQPPGRDPALLHRHLDPVVAAREQEQEGALRKLLELGGSPSGQAEVLGRLAGSLRSRALMLSIRAQSEQDAGDADAAGRDRAQGSASRTEAIARYSELLKKYPQAPRTDEALFFLADALQDAGRDDEAVKAARELTRRFPHSAWAPASHVFVGEHLFDAAKLEAALEEYRAAAEVTTDEVYPYALYKAAWCRFNQSAFVDAMKLLKKVVDVSAGAGDVNTVQLAREARRDYVLAYGRIGRPEAAHDDFVRNFGVEAALKMLEQYGKLLFDTGRDPEAQQIARQLLGLHGNAPAAALDQTRLLVIAQRTGKRKDLLQQARLLVDTFQHVRNDPADEKQTEANRLGEETLRNLAVQIHNEARKTELDETWAAARALYADYLTLFPDAPDAYDLRFFYGELLYTRGAKAQAAEQYEAVVKADLAAKQPGKWRTKAAWSAVLSRDEAINGARPEAKDTGQRRSQRPLTADEQKLAAACRLYLQALPEGPHAVEVAFKVGRFEYLSGDLDAAQKHLAGIALQHQEHELAETAANLVLDISNLRKDWNGLHAWAGKFLGDKRLTAHGTLLQDLRRIEEESAYALADAVSPDARKAEALLAFVPEHPHGRLADKALFGAAAALSRAGRIDDALAARARVWKEQPQSPLVPRALLASAADLSAVGDLGEAAALLEKYAQGWQRQEAARNWRREHNVKKPAGEGPNYEEARAQSGLHDAALLREARGEFRQAIADRATSQRLWKSAADHDQSLFAVAELHARLGETARAAREMASLARAAGKVKPALELSAWREAARFYGKARETGNAQWSWTQVERIWSSLGPRAREKLPPESLAAAAEAHLALGAIAFDEFKRQPIQAPLMLTLNRKIARLQKVKKRAEETVAMRQAEPAVCARRCCSARRWRRVLSRPG